MTFRSELRSAARRSGPGPGRRGGAPRLSLSSRLLLPPSPVVAALFGLAVGAASLAPATLAAQTPASGPAAPRLEAPGPAARLGDATRAGGPDFFLGQPRGSILLRGGWTFARAGSDIFDFTTERLTVDRSDFNAATVGLEVAVRFDARTASVFGIGFSRAAERSEFREFVDQQDRPIEQTTELTQLPITAGLRLYLLPAGQPVGRFAWLPARLAPYLGAGGGLVWYRFEQVGRFVDYVDLSIFRDRFRSSGWTPTAHLLAGLDLSLAPRLGWTVEARYAWASAGMNEDFQDFETIDLSGLQTTIGVHWRF